MANSYDSETSLKILTTSVFDVVEPNLTRCIISNKGLNEITFLLERQYKCFSKRVAKRIRNLQAKFINTRMTSFWMYVSAAAILVGPNTLKFLRDVSKRKLLLKSVYMYTILLFLNLIPLRRYMLTSISNCEIYRHDYHTRKL